MTSLSLSTLLDNAMHFNAKDGLLCQTAERFTVLFKEQGIRYYIVGGFALIIHGLIRNTIDVDIIVYEQDFSTAIEVRPFFSQLDEVDSLSL